MENPAYIAARVQKPKEAPDASRVLAPGQIDPDLGNFSDKFTPERKAAAAARFRNVAMILPTGRKR